MLQAEVAIAATVIESPVHTGTVVRYAVPSASLGLPVEFRSPPV